MIVYKCKRAYLRRRTAMKAIGKYIDRSIEILFQLILCAILGFLLIGFLTFPIERQTNIYSCQELDLDWYQVLDDGSRIPAEVPGKCDTPKGQTLTLTGILPDTLDAYETPWLCFRSTLQDMTVSIDGELRGTYSTKDTRLWGKNSVSAYYFVRLKPSDRGKEITFSCTTDSKYSGVVRQPYCGTVFGMFLRFAKDNLFEVMSALLLLILSIGTILICGLIHLQLQRKIPLSYLGWTVLLLCIWILSESPLRQFYYKNLSLAGYMTHFAVYFLALPLLLYFDNVQAQRYHKLYRVLLSVEMCYSLFASVLEITGAGDFSLLFNICVILHLLSISCIIFTIIRDIQNHLAGSYNFVIVGFVGFAIAGILQLGMYLQKTVIFHGGFFSVGALFWLAMSVLSALRDYYRLEQENLTNHVKTLKLTRQAMNTLVETIEAKDPYTKGHSTRVAKYSKLLAEKMGLSKEEQNAVYSMGMLHDIGKIGIADTIINKPGKLTSEEYATIKTHTTIGYQILNNMDDIKDIEKAARWHHERYDGKGYPDGLKGEEIPLYARIIAVADMYDAMTSNRSYRQVMPQQAVRDEIQRVKGSQLDPRIANCMLEIIDEDKDYHLRQETPLIPA